jgi:uncharacterized OsmC-like protein
MTVESISKAMQRVRAVLARRPQSGIHADEPAVAHWNSGMRVVSRHSNGTQVATDMPVELGGAGDQLTPGWLLRAALASCLATRIVMEAAAAGITIARLEVLARSTSDARGLLGMVGEGGHEVPAAPYDVCLDVRISTPGVPRERTHSMVADSFRRSPVSAAVEKSLPLALHIESDPG